MASQDLAHAGDHAIACLGRERAQRAVDPGLVGNDVGALAGLDGGDREHGCFLRRDRPPDQILELEHDERTDTHEIRSEMRPRAVPTGSAQGDSDAVDRCVGDAVLVAHLTDGKPRVDVQGQRRATPVGESGAHERLGAARVRLLRGLPDEPE